MENENSATGTRTRVARVRAEYPNQLDYGGFCVNDAGQNPSYNSVLEYPSSTPRAEVIEVGFVEENRETRTMEWSGQARARGAVV